MKKITITLASDESPALLDCADLLEASLDFELVALLTDLTVQGAWQALARSSVLVIDEALVLRDGFEPLNMLLASYPEVRCLLLLKNYQKNKMIWTLMQGVRGVLTVDEIRPQLHKAIRQIMAGEIWMPRHLMQPIREGLQQDGDGSYFFIKPTSIKEWVKWH
ncbi:MAG: hypothetical protein ABFS22_11075 [Pseudomonadota bacterium]